MTPSASDTSRTEPVRSTDAQAAEPHGDARERLNTAYAQCDHLAGEVFRLRERHQATSFQLEVARATIANMERSWFWRTRLLVVRLRQRIGL